MTTYVREAREWRSRDEFLTFLRRQTWVTPGSIADDRLLAELDRVAEHAGPEGPDGGITVPGNVASRIGLVRWSARAA